MSKPKTKFRIAGTDFIQTVEGQEARTLNALVDAGARGITALEVSTWALRLAHYCLKLRGRGLSIEMAREDHSGPGGKGWHGRYYLKTPVQIIETSVLSEAA